MNNFELLTEEELYMIDGGKTWGEFGYEVGHDAHSAYKYGKTKANEASGWLWTHTIGCTPAY